MRVAIVGASGAVGQEFLRVLDERNFPIDELLLFGSQRSAGTKYTFRGKEIEVKLLQHNDDFKGVDIAFTSAGGGTSKEFAETITKHGAVMIDNSSAFRMDEDVPLVVPECNAKDALDRPRGIIANPNCTTIITLMALYPLHLKFGLKTIIASSYQAVSGSGQHGITELENQVRAICDGHPVEISTYPRQIAFNVLPQIDKFADNGYTKEELKMLNEGRKIMSLPELKVTCTCVRVPVYRSHSISCVAQFEQPVDVEAARACFDGKPGVALMDDTDNNVWPTPLDSTNGDTCYVGRIRKDLAIDNALNLWVVGDQVRKGAALNAVQIAELLVSRA